MNLIQVLNEWGESWAGFMWSRSVEALTAFAMVYVIWFLLRKRISPQLGYGLFFLVFVKILCPIQISLPDHVQTSIDRTPFENVVRWNEPPWRETFVGSIHTDESKEMGKAALPKSSQGNEMHAAQHASKSSAYESAAYSLTIFALAMMGWGITVFFLLTRFLWRQWRFVRLVHRAESLSDNELTVDFPRLKESMQIRRLISIKSSSSIAAPVVWGFFRPILLLPPDFCRFYSRSQMRWILLHELAHIRRFDTMAATLQKIMQIFFFFHPVIWLSNWIIDQQREYACDDMALMSCGASRMECGKGFLALVQRMNDASMIPPNATTLGLIKYHTQIRRRMMRMLDSQRTLHIRLSRKTIGALVLAALIILPTVRAVEKNAGDDVLALNQEELDDSPKDVAAILGQEFFEDPDNGLRFQKFASLKEEPDIDDWDVIGKCTLSPNQKFMLHNTRTYPLNGETPFDLIDFPGYHGSWSPDGTKIAFSSAGIWVVPVSPDTAKPTGAPQKLIEGEYGAQYRIAWFPNSEKFAYTSSQWDSAPCIYDIQDGSQTQIIDEKAGVISCSPDGKWIACIKREGYIWLASVTGETQHRLAPWWKSYRWSPNGDWIVCGDRRNFKFVRISDAFAFEITLPDEIGGLLSWSGDGRKLYFYKTSKNGESFVKIIPLSGGAPLEFIKKSAYSSPAKRWTPDSRFLVVNDGDQYYVVPVDGGRPFPLEVDIELSGSKELLWIWPDRKKMLFRTMTDGKNAYWIAPISVEQGKNTSKPVKIFDKEIRGFDISPDGDKILVSSEYDIWMISLDGSPAVQITNTPEHEFSAHWLADGKTIAWSSRLYDNDGKSVLRSALYNCALGQVTPKKVIDIDGSAAFMPSEDLTYVVYQVDDGNKATLSVFFVPEGKTQKLMEIESSRARNLRYDFSPDNQELSVMLDDKISAYSLRSGAWREIADLSDPNLGALLPAVQWSPDGKTLALLAYSKTETSSDERTRLFTVPAVGGEPTELALDDPGFKLWLNWSPDGKWLTYDSDREVKNRNEGIIWEVDISELLKNAENTITKNEKSAE